MYTSYVTTAEPFHNIMYGNVHPSTGRKSLKYSVKSPEYTLNKDQLPLAVIIAVLAVYQIRLPPHSSSLYTGSSPAYLLLMPVNTLIFFQLPSLDFCPVLNLYICKRLGEPAHRNWAVIYAQNKNKDFGHKYTSCWANQ
jgi:hypothetical protein